MAKSLPITNYDTMPQVDRVVVIAAGPSAKKAMHKVEKWIDSKTIVIVTNYKFPIKADYTFFVKTKIFKRMHQKVDGKIVIASPLCKLGQYQHNKTKRWLMKRVMIFKCRSSPKVWNVDEVKINKDCIVKHDIASSGFGALILATYCRPKELMLIGFDGPTVVKSKKNPEGRYTLKHFNGRTQGRPMDKDHKRIKIEYRAFLRDKMIPFLFNSGIKDIYVCREDKLRGINKKKLKLKVI
tara:strand:+ start:856 stop:1572 length:717 start_codon:yes stop_codon:yes gene_type:complete